MLLTGLSLITLLSLQDPLRDRFLGRSTIWYFGMGFIGLYVLLFFNMKRFTTDSGLYRMFALKSNRSAAKGWQWAALAIGLLVLTILLGSGPEGSGVKVNLFGFQPSEVVKFLIVVFWQASLLPMKNLFLNTAAGKDAGLSFHLPWPLFSYRSFYSSFLVI
jgi:cell division protein FtsW (lipid II flippase)